MAKGERLNEEAARNNNLHSSTIRNDVELSKELQDRKIEKDANQTRISRS
ncbi:hypothetical protein [Alkalihalobacillus sp. AL-G]|nr:hypothetical protein [Alkalihalobacillus sp. AL-G]WLD93609.1 hypothetical protein MOJ78_01325 [Alkalihalobacillus sp. AL-G]